MRHLIFLAVLLPILLGGCSSADKPAWLSLNPNDWSNRAQTDDPITLEVTGPVAVDVESFSGDVTITSNPKLEQASVTVRREGVHGPKRADEAEASLDQISFTADVVPGELGQVLQIRATTTSAEPHYQRAHLFIELPDVNGVTVRTANGKVTARHIQGAVDIETTDGDVRVLSNRAMTQPVTIVNRNGDIDYRVRGESAGRFDAQTVNGKVTHIVRFGTMMIEPQADSDVLRATFNGGTNPIVLRTVNGDIRIAVVHNPEQVGVRIVD